MIAAEYLMAVAGIFPGKGHPSATDLIAMGGVPDRWKSRAKRWMRMYDDDAREPRKFEAPDPPEEKKLQDKLLKTINGEKDVDILGGIPDPALAAEYLDKVKSACRYIDSKWPKNPVPGAYAEVFPLSTEELDDVWALVRIADNPEILWDELEAESLSIPMIECWRACYPEMSAETLVMLDGMLIERHAADKPLAWQQEDFVHMLKGEDTEAPIEIVSNNPKAESANGKENVQK